MCAADYIENPEDYKDFRPFVTLGDAAHQALTSLWWRMAAEGMRLPAEAGVILISGRRP
jgi:hypothetical protein